MSNDLMLTSQDPSTFGWPSSLPLEVALHEHPVQRICEGYGITRPQWDKLRVDPVFQAAVTRYVEALKSEGMSFKLKAQLQSEALLKESWKLIHNSDTPANVRADLIKATYKAAGVDGGGKNDQQGQQPTFAIQINL
jgi:hypothetical protein